MVYVLASDGKPLMPTTRYGKVRRMLKSGRARVVRRTPFTIQLLYKSGQITQQVSLGVDAGSKHIGISATTERKELLSAQVEIRQDINRLLVSRRESRQTRRSRKTRYRKPRFQNRTRPKGWLAPSVNAKAETHVTVVRKACSLLPVTEIHVEMAPFDTQRLKAELLGQKRPEGRDYQKGEMAGYDNLKAYVKWRDGYKCAVCGAEHVPLEVHHRIQRHNGGTNAPSNLITVCHDCHVKYHAGGLTGKKAHLMDPDAKSPKMRDASFMGIMRWAVWERLKTFGLSMYMTYGYRTARVREECHLPKDHRVDARCISGHPKVVPSDEWFFCKKVRCHNRQIHKKKILPGGIRKRNQAPYEVFGYRLFDKVACQGQTGFIHARRSSGSFDIRTLDGDRISAGISYKKLMFLEPRRNILVERRPA